MKALWLSLEQYTNLSEVRTYLVQNQVKLGTNWDADCGNAFLANFGLAESKFITQNTVQNEVCRRYGLSYQIIGSIVTQNDAVHTYEERQEALLTIITAVLNVATVKAPTENLEELANESLATTDDPTTIKHEHELVAV